MLIMRSRLLTISSLLVLLLFGGTIHGTVNITGVSGVDLTEANAFDAKYTQFASAFSKYYGDAMAFSSHLSAPNARDNLGRFPSLYFGIGVGGSFGKVNAMKNSVDSSIQSSVPPYLAAPAISFNFGIGINRKWDLRFSFFPNVPISLGSSAFGSGTSAEVKLGTYRARAGYHVLEGGFLKPGLTVAGFASYTTGGISYSRTGQSISSGQVSLTNATTALSTSWQYLGVGPEARVWYDLKFFHPFIGYSLGLQVGQFTTGLDVNGTVTISGTNYGTGSIVISERKAAQLWTHRLMFGFEIALLVLDIGVEAQVDLVNGLVGVAVGTAFRF
jgi:hypothetical protein